MNGTPILSSVSYEPFGPADGWTWGNGSAFSRTFNGDGEISGISAPGSTESLSYDAADRISGITNTATGSSNWTYGYDALDRLTSAASGTATDGWTYDADGNRLTQTGTAASTYSIASASNQITGITGTLARSYSYDAAGNTLSDSNETATYDDVGRLNTLSTSAGSTTFVYNALGQMIEASGSSGTTLYVYDQAGHLLGEYDGSGNLIQETIWLGDIPVATIRPSGSSVAIYYVETDQLDKPREVIRPSDNAVMWSWFSGPFGSAEPNENPAGAGTFAYDLRFPGQIAGAWGSTFQNDFRDYDPAIGRYIESDPTGLYGGSYSTYLYSLANSVSGSDRFGLGGEEDEEPTDGDPAETNAIIQMQYQSLLLQIREYDPSYEDRGYRPPNTPVNRSDISRLQQELYDLKYSRACYKPGYSSEFRRKPGSLGLFKGVDAHDAENRMARDAANAAGLDKAQRRLLHTMIGGQGYSYADIERMAIDIKNGTY